MKNKKKWPAILLFALSIFIIAACSENDSVSDNESDAGEAAESSVTGNYSIGTQPPGVTFHTLGSEFGKVISEESDVKITVKPFAGPDAWAPLLNKGDVDFGTDNAYLLAHAFLGIETFDGKPNKNMRTLAVGTRTPVAGLLVREDANIEKIADLKGKRVASEFSGSTVVHTILDAHLKSGGIDWDDVKQVPVSDIPGGLEALRNGTVDAAFVGLPTNSIFLEVDNAVGVKTLNWADIAPEDIENYPQESADYIDKVLPGMIPYIFEDGGVVKDEKATLIASNLAIAVGAHVSDEVVYDILETMWEHYEKWDGTLLDGWTPEELSSELYPPAPFHDGAVQFFKDKDLWTDEAEEEHQRLLELAKE